MKWLLLFVAVRAFAENPHLPPEMKQKASEVGEAAVAAYHAAHSRVRRAEQDSNLVHGALEDLRALWRRVKAKGRAGVVYLDHQLHAHVIGPEPRSPER